MSKLTITVVEIKNVQDGSWFDTLDPYIELAIGEKSATTPPKNNAGANAKFDCALELPKGPLDNALMVRVWDSDTDLIGGKKSKFNDDIVAECTVDLSKIDLVGSPYKVLSFDLMTKGKKNGQVFLSFKSEPPVAPAKTRDIAPAPKVSRPSPKVAPQVSPRPKIPGTDLYAAKAGEVFECSPEGNLLKYGKQVELDEKFAELCSKAVEGAPLPEEIVKELGLPSGTCWGVPSGQYYGAYGGLMGPSSGPAPVMGSQMIPNYGMYPMQAMPVASGSQMIPNYGMYPMQAMPVASYPVMSMPAPAAPAVQK